MTKIHAIPTADLKKAAEDLMWENCQFLSASERANANFTLPQLRAKLGLDESWTRLAVKPPTV
mgnify:FL=1